MARVWEDGMALHMGPVLSFRGASGDFWRTSALWVLDDADGRPGVSVAGKALPAPAVVPLAQNQGRTVWRADWGVPQGAAPQTIEYGLAGATASHYVVPARGPVLRVGYASCNGFSHPRYMKGVRDQNERWKDLNARSVADPLHLLILGGDQVYGDSIWSPKAMPRLARWLEKSWDDRIAAGFSDSLRQAVASFYFDLYCERWSQADPKQALSTIPTLMMWDDHDIFDGWGSYPDDMQSCRVYEGIFDEAKRAFRVFQLQLADGEEPAGGFAGQQGLGYGHVLGKVAVLALDLRSERTSTHILSEATWQAALAWLSGLPKNELDHLLVLTSIPVVYPGFGALEATFGVLPGHQELEDDLRDHWTSRPHREERIRLVRRLLAFSRDHRCRVSILSGDVHVAALGVLDSARSSSVPENANVINQLISSAVVHTPPPALAAFALKLLGSRDDELDRDIVARMIPFAGTDSCFVAKRNWMSLTFDRERRFWTEWWAEGEKEPYRKVVHAVG